ncbi:MAG: hypothetical protein E7312_07540 [Clostridiales bacterium]|nr:hypothetical protein [Clostridiales bacterium]
MKTEKNALLRTLCIVLLAVLLILQFLPYWHIDDESASIHTLVWLPNNYQGILTNFKTLAGPSFKMDSWVWIPIILLLTEVLGIFFLISRPESFYGYVLAVACGVVGSIAYIADIVLHSGSIWYIHFAICVLITVMAITLSIRLIKGVKNT